jgi:hypothetical protein
LFKAQFTWETLMHLGILLAYGAVLHIFALRRMTARVLR